MPTVSFSINVDPNEPQTNCKIPVTFAIYLVQAFICILFVALAFGTKEAPFFIFSALQAIITVVFLLNLYYVIVLHFVAQCAGLIVNVGVFVGLLIEAVDRRENFRHNGELWMAWISILGNIYYANLVFQHLNYQKQLRSKKSIPTPASAPNEENSNQNLLDNNVGDIEKQIYPRPSLQKF